MNCLQPGKKMSIRCSVFIASSVDGFIARDNGDIDWLEKPGFDSQQGLHLTYDKFIKTVDTIVMGRKTFEKVLSFSEWIYGEIPLIVLSTQNLKIPHHLAGKVTIDRGDPKDIITRIAPSGNHHLYIDGGYTIQNFLKSGLINDITITRIPVILGSGISLFGTIGLEFSLHHIKTSTARNGLVQSQYSVIVPDKGKAP